jgi:hypothetical protein
VFVTAGVERKHASQRAFTFSVLTAAGMLVSRDAYAPFSIRYVRMEALTVLIKDTYGVPSSSVHDHTTQCLQRFESMRATIHSITHTTMCPSGCGDEHAQTMSVMSCEWEPDVHCMKHTAMCPSGCGDEHPQTMSVMSCEWEPNVHRMKHTADAEWTCIRTNRV